MYDGVNAYMEIDKKDVIYLEKANDIGKGFFIGSIVVWIICVIWAFSMWKGFKIDGYKNNK